MEKWSAETRTGWEEGMEMVVGGNALLERWKERPLNRTPAL